MVHIPVFAIQAVVIEIATDRRGGAIPRRGRNSPKASPVPIGTGGIAGERALSARKLRLVAIGNCGTRSSPLRTRKLWLIAVGSGSTGGCALGTGILWLIAIGSCRPCGGTLTTGKLRRVTIRRGCSGSGTLHSRGVIRATEAPLVHSFVGRHSEKIIKLTAAGSRTRTPSAKFSCSSAKTAGTLAAAIKS